ncbi:MAG: type II toxin-antitoxin system VapC family toxin [Nitrososphaerota archaeon]|nr:type II toxin-antitoxin system VapC family toxin [Nitrososphaerota archaeon]MDG6946037.1 type II toxin-antitoxin system VapC family toxin [Nitrososphaerota archaeon]
MLLDTNVFLEFMLGGEEADGCLELLGRLSRGELEGAVTRSSLHSIEALSDPGVSREFLSDVDRSLGLAVYDTDTQEEREVAETAKRTGLDFDAMQYYVAKKLGAEALVSFDRHFDRLDLKRVEPAEPGRGGRARSISGRARRRGGDSLHRALTPRVTQGPSLFLRF